MQAPFDNIVQHLFHQPSLHSVTVDELENMAAKHPYFAAAHFLLLKKMQDTAHPHFTTQLHKTTIYFNNPLWLQYLLQPGTVADFTVSDKSPFIDSEPIFSQPFTGEEKDHEHSVDIVSDDAVAPALNTVEVQSGDNFNAYLNEDKLGGTELNQQVARSEEGGIMNVISEVFSDPNPLYNMAPVEAFNIVTPQEITAMPAMVPLEITSQEIQDHDHINSQFITEEITAGASTAEQRVEENGTHPEENFPDSMLAASAIVHEEKLPAPADASAENAQIEPTPETIISDNTEDDFEAGTLEADDTDAIPGISSENQKTEAYQTTFSEPKNTENVAPELPGAAINLVKTIIETLAAKNDVLFEPYHTVDYFASQGIKLSKMEADSKDKLGRQLKSFTEWLKTMKKLPQVSINKILAENEESKVVEDANHSIETKEVITEAMAEVFEKQGLNDKAAEIYQKLSLLNPAKSAYFAARMEDLKH